LEAYVAGLEVRTGRPVVVLGDLNVAFRDVDVSLATRYSNARDDMLRARARYKCTLGQYWVKLLLFSRSAFSPSIEFAMISFVFSLARWRFVLLSGS